MEYREATDEMLADCVSKVAVFDLLVNPNTKIITMLVEKATHNVGHRIQMMALKTIDIICTDKRLKSIIKSQVDYIEMNIMIVLFRNVSDDAWKIGLKALHNSMKCERDSIKSDDDVTALIKGLCSPARFRYVDAFYCMAKAIEQYSAQVEPLVEQYIYPVIWAAMESEHHGSRLGSLVVFNALMEKRILSIDSPRVLLAPIFDILTKHGSKECRSRYNGNDECHGTVGCVKCWTWYNVECMLRALMKSHETQIVPEVIEFICRKFHDIPDDFESGEICKKVELISNDCRLFCKFPTFSAYDYHDGLIAYEALLGSDIHGGSPNYPIVIRLTKKLLPTIINLLFHTEVSIRMKSIDVCKSMCYKVPIVVNANMNPDQLKYIVWGLKIGLVGSEESKHAAELALKHLCVRSILPADEIRRLRYHQQFLWRYGPHARITPDTFELVD